MITVKINSEVKLQKYMNNGLKIFINLNKDKSKWFIIKLNEHQTELLRFILEIIKDVN